MDQGAHFQTQQKPFAVMNVHNGGRKHLGDGKRRKKTLSDGIQKLNDGAAKNSPSFKCFNRWIITSTHYLTLCMHTRTNTNRTPCAASNNIALMKCHESLMSPDVL